MSAFSCLDVARRALSVSQKAIDITGHNIANANTVGYSRQRLSTVSIEPATGPTRLSAGSNILTGGGVAIVTVDQVRSPFLDRQFRKENALTGEWGTRAEGLAYVESLFDELNGTGLSQAMANFGNSLQELSKDPASFENRTAMVQNALSMTETLHHYAAQLADKQAEQDQAVTTLTTQINTIAENIADFNERIALYEINGLKANDLRDQRANLLDQLSGLIAVTSGENPQGQLQVMIGGQALVSHTNVSLLANERTVDNPLNSEADSLHSVIWADSGMDVEITGGSMKAYIDMRDGASADQFGLPYMSAQLDRLADALAYSFNEIHEAGWTLPNALSGSPSMTGVPFFTTLPDPEGNPRPMSAASITVSPQIRDDLSLIAASSEEVASETENGNNQNALDLLTVFSRQDLPEVGNLAAFLNGVVSGIAIESEQARNREEAQFVLTDSLDQQRQSVSGVSLDEETTSLIKFQHSYAAAARVISAVDEMLDILVNRTGIVGR